MGKDYLRSYILVIPLLFISINLFAQVTRLRGDWWKQAAKPSRHSILTTSYDSSTSSNADMALGNPLAGGFGMEIGVPGKYGNAVRVAEDGGHLHYVGENNFNSQQGTVRLFARGNFWVDETPRWIWEARGSWRIGVKRDPQKISLLIHKGMDIENPVGRVDLAIDNIDPDQWHSVVASWDREAGIASIALDGIIAANKIEFSPLRNFVYVIYIGGGFGGRLGGLNEPGMEIDELVIYNQPLNIIEADTDVLTKTDMELLPEVEKGIRKYLYFWGKLQRWGGWQYTWTWPTLMGSSYQGREGLAEPNVISNDKSYASPRIAMDYLYAWEVLGDYSFFEIAMRTGDLFLAAQDPRGFWVNEYKMTVEGIKANVDETNVKLQDSGNSHPIFLLACLYKITGEEKYLEAVKKGGEFYLQAQNPNGSYSHHWDAKAGIGRTESNRHGQGGELNDLATNDAIDVLALLFHLTKDRRYADALKRVGDWLVEAQLKGATRGWAQQYDSENNPAQARHFEPPAVATDATIDACKALVEIYRFSNDEKYLKPIRECLNWIEKTFPDGETWHYLDPKTGKGIAQWQYKIYYLDNEEDFNWLTKQPIGYWYLVKTNMTARIKTILENADAAGENIEINKQWALKTLADYREEVRKLLTTQNGDGVWVTNLVANFSGSIGAGITKPGKKVVAMLKYIEAARMLLGEIPYKKREGGRLHRQVLPSGDWYYIKW